MNETKTLPGKGGTEILLGNLHKYVSAELLGKVHFSVSAAVGRARHLKLHIFWAHQSYDQPSVANLRDPLVQNTIDWFVFVSEWQREQYVKYLYIPIEKSVVIRNAIEPIAAIEKSKGRLKLVYTSTPFRGLDVLLDAFLILGRAEVELHIYSGMGLYGRAHEDVTFKELYARADAMENVVFHGVVSNNEVREAVQQSHIFAYPSTWEETSCLAMIEAMSAGCLAVVPELGALPETASGFAQLYDYESDKVRRFFCGKLHVADEERGVGTVSASDHPVSLVVTLGSFCIVWVLYEAIFLSLWLTTQRIDVAYLNPLAKS